MAILIKVEAVPVVEAVHQLHAQAIEPMVGLVPALKLTLPFPESERPAEESSEESAFE